jgi:hypothetical protein
VEDDSVEALPGSVDFDPFVGRYVRDLFDLDVKDENPLVQHLIVLQIVK